MLEHLILSWFTYSTLCMQNDWLASPHIPSHHIVMENIMFGRDDDPWETYDLSLLATSTLKET
jgi:hypothetical protein